MTGPRTTVLQRSLGTTPREIIAPDPQRSFRCVMHDFPCDVCGWAAHPEYEIHLIRRSTGSLIVPRCPTAWKETLRVWGDPRGDWPVGARVKEALDPAGVLNPGRFVGAG